MPLSPPLAALVAILPVAACGGAAAPGAAGALYRDARKVIDVQDSSGWFVESAELEEARETLLESVCRVDDPTQLETLRWIERELTERGGPAEAAWHRRGRDTSAVNDLLTLERMRDAINAARDSSDEDCPFWVEPDPEFAGVHSDAHRVVFFVESGGSAGIIVRGSDAAIGGAGGGRVLVGYGVDDELTLALGVEVGGVATFATQDESASSIAAEIAAGMPFLVRFRDSVRIYDLEVAWLSRYQSDGFAPPGFRVSVGYGLSALRGAGLMPQGVLWLAYGLQPALESGVEHSFLIGTRVGIDFDP